jgi:hypothetical protein
VRGAPLLVLLGAVVFGIIGYLAGFANKPEPPAAAPPAPAAPSSAPPVLQQLGTPKDLCCCQILADGETYLSDALKKYETARGHGDHMQACYQAGCVVDGYNRIVNGPHPVSMDIAYLGHWRQIEKAECAAEGYLPRQR